MIGLCKPVGRRALLRAVSLLVPFGLAAARAGGEAVPFRVLVLGDSQAQGLAGGVQRLFRHDRRFRVLDRSKIGTGLISRAYDWTAAVRSFCGAEHADVALIMFGANDRPPVRINGSVDPMLTYSFELSYGERVREIVQSLREANIPVIWVGHPTVRDPKYADDMALLNRIYEDEATAAGAEYVPIWPLFAGPDGKYQPYGKGPDGETTRLRADDGVHMTPAGYDLLAQYIEPRIEAESRARSEPGALPGVPAVQPVRHHQAVQTDPPADAER